MTIKYFEEIDSSKLEDYYSKKFELEYMTVES